MENQKKRQYYAYLSITLLLLITISAFLAPAIHAQDNTPSITTDKEDYSPEETVIITGTGFNPNTEVTLTLTLPDNTTETWTVTSDDTGALSTTFQLNGIEGTYTLTATDGEKTATTTFTDSPWKKVTVTAKSGGSVRCEYDDKEEIVNGGETETFKVWAGTKITFTAIPNQPCEFKNWTIKWHGIPFESKENPLTLKVKSGLTVTAHFKLPTEITDLKCEPNPVNKYGPETTKISGYLKLKSSTTGIANATIILSYYDGTSGTIGTCNTASNGYFYFDWDVPEALANDFYFIKAEFAGNDDYCGTSAVTSEGGRLHVIPEYLLGGLLALAACFVAFAAFNKIQIFSKSRNHK